MYQHIKVPEEGKKIEVDRNNLLTIPDNPIIPFIDRYYTGYAQSG